MGKFVVVTPAVPAVVISDAPIVALISVALMKVEGTAAPFQRTPELGTKLMPRIVKAN
ncbi:MAG: hypothetical protein L0Y75_08480 [Acidobacteria bacterium]|nr:hypothetical protein [Acidobacteriota bacterium]